VIFDQTQDSQRLVRIGEQDFAPVRSDRPERKTAVHAIANRSGESSFRGQITLRSEAAPLISASAIFVSMTRMSIIRCHTVDYRAVSDRPHEPSVSPTFD